MSESSLSRFFQALNQDEELAREYHTTVGQAVRSAVWPAIVEVAAKRGMEFSPEELGAWLTEQHAELSEEALEGVTGGARYLPSKFPSLAILGVAAAGGVIWAATDTGSDDDDYQDRTLSP